MEVNANNINYISQYLFNSTDTSNNSKTNFLDNIQNSYKNYLSISSFGQKLNDIYNSLQNMENSSDKENALLGARSIITNFASNSNASDFTQFAQSIGNLEKNNETAFQKFFITANDINKNHYNLSKWVTTFSDIDTSQHQENFITESNNIIKSNGSSYEKINTFNNFLDTLTKIENGFKQGELKTDAFNSFFNGIGNYSNIVDKNNFITQFNDNISNIA